MMKKLQVIGVALMATMFFTSFEADAKTNITNGVSIEGTISIDGSVEITKYVITELDSDCGDWLKSYEAYVDKYIVIIKKMKANPADASIMGDYTQLMGQAAKWATMPDDCSGDMAFLAKFTKMQTKLSKAML
jgi:hypothetical protein